MRDTQRKAMLSEYAGKEDNVCVIRIFNIESQS